MRDSGGQDITVLVVEFFNCCSAVCHSQSGSVCPQAELAPSHPATSYRSDSGLSSGGTTVRPEWLTLWLKTDMIFKKVSITLSPPLFCFLYTEQRRLILNSVRTEITEFLLPVCILRSISWLEWDLKIFQQWMRKYSPNDISSSLLNIFKHSKN